MKSTGVLYDFSFHYILRSGGGHSVRRHSHKNMFGVKVHTKDFDEALEKTVEFFENDAIPIMAKIVLADTKKKMSKGVKPSSGNLYRGYKDGYKAYRQRSGLQVDHVDFEVTGGLKKNIKFFESEKMITVEDDYDKIAQGLTEGNGNGLVARDFFEVGQDSIDKGVAAIEVKFNELK